MHKSPQDLVREIAGRYDDTGRLAEQVLAALARRVAKSGKVCSRCRLERALSAFGARSESVDGLHDVCRRCRARARPKARITVM